MMRKILVFSLCLFLSSAISSQNDCISRKEIKIYKKAIQLILEDSLTRDYLINKHNSNYDLFISDSIISFDISYFYWDIVQNNKTQKYDLFTLSDSLDKIDSKRNYTNFYCPQLKSLASNKTNNVVFFTKLIDNYFIVLISVARNPNQGFNDILNFNDSIAYLIYLNKRKLQVIHKLYQHWD